MKLYRDIDYYLFFQDFPCMGAHGFVGSNQDGTVSIYINTLYCERMQRKTIRHELRHVALNHLWRDDMEEQDKENEANDGLCEKIQIANDYAWVEVTENEAVS